MSSLEYPKRTNRLLSGSLSGKTSIIEKIVNDTFSKTIDSTNGASYSSKSYYYLNKKIKL